MLYNNLPSCQAGFRPTTTGRWFAWATVVRSGLAVLICVQLSGCAWVRHRLANRSEECSQLCDRARNARDEGRVEESNHYLNAAVRQRPADYDTRRMLIEELWSNGRQLAAANELEELLISSPDDAAAALRLAQMQLEIGRTEAARTAIETAARLEPENPEVIRLLARVAERSGKPDAAIAAYLRIVRNDPQDVAAHLALAELYLRRGQPDRAAPVLRTVSQHGQATVEQRQAADWQLGAAYAQTGRWNDAADVLTLAVCERPATTADEWYRVAYAQSRAGRMNDSIHSAQQALALDPQHLAAAELARGSGPATAQSGSVLPAGFRSATANPGRPTIH